MWMLAVDFEARLLKVVEVQKERKGAAPSRVEAGGWANALQSIEEVFGTYTAVREGTRRARMSPRSLH
jgi:hypothetical protein